MIFSKQLGSLGGRTAQDDIRYMANHIRRMQEELEYRLAHLDSQNITEIDMGQTKIFSGDVELLTLIKDNDKISSIQQTVDSISSTVAAQGQSISSLQQTSTSITATVADLKTGMSTAVRLTAEGLLITGTNTRIKTSALQNDSGYQTKTQVTTITNNAISTAEISADQITAGTLYADEIGLDGLFEIMVDGMTYGYMGGSDIGETSGAALTGKNQKNAVLVTNTGAQLLYNMGDYKIWVASNGCWSNEEMAVYSDRRLKNNISYGLEAEELFFMHLRPCAFQLNSDNKGKINWGFIAQEVIEGAEIAGLDPEKLSVVKNSEGIYGLAYGHFTALNTHMIQKLMGRVTALEEAIA